MERSRQTGGWAADFGERVLLSCSDGREYVNPTYPELRTLAFEVFVNKKFAGLENLHDNNLLLNPQNSYEKAAKFIYFRNLLELFFGDQFPQPIRFEKLKELWQLENLTK